MKRTFRKIKDPRIEAKLQKILSEPIGTPIELTREEAIAIVEAGIATEEDIDQAMMTGRNWPAGYFGRRGGIGKEW